MRDSLNLTLSEPLRRANVRPRLAALADQTGFAATQIAGRALTIGLRLIEADLCLLFPGSGSSSPATPSTPTLRAAEHAEVGASTAPHGAARPTDATQDTASHRGAQPAPAPQHLAAPSASPDHNDSPTTHTAGDEWTAATEEAARELGHASASAFREHVRRHADLKRWSRRCGRSLRWNLDGLRADYARHEYHLRGPSGAHESPPTGSA